MHAQIEAERTAKEVKRRKEQEARLARDSRQLALRQVLEEKVALADMHLTRAHILYRGKSRPYFSLSVFVIVRCLYTSAAFMSSPTWPYNVCACVHVCVHACVCVCVCACMCCVCVLSDIRMVPVAVSAGDASKSREPCHCSGRAAAATPCLLCMGQCM